jgi:hypothetical protein
MIKFNHDFESISKCMGLPDGREQEIKKEIINLVATNDDFITVMEKIVLKINNEAELLYTFFAIGEMAGVLNPEAKKIKDSITIMVSFARMLQQLKEGKADKSVKTENNNPTKNPINWE